uniref:Myb-like domain-containing protein n=1 Tax=Haptolina ericina TaxID=156174 RepID=A0A7S3EYJ8_9EUKA
MSMIFKLDSYATDAPQGTTKYAAHSAPSRLRKRDSNVYEELELLDSVRRGTYAETLSGPPMGWGSMSPTAHRTAMENLSHGSWSRRAARRTDSGDRLNLWEVSAALSTAATEPPAPADEAAEHELTMLGDFALDDLEALVAVEAAEAGTDMSMEDSMSFVDAVFGSQPTASQQGHVVVCQPTAVADMMGSSMEPLNDMFDLLQSDQRREVYGEAHGDPFGLDVSFDSFDSSPTSVTALFKESVFEETQPIGAASTALVCKKQPLVPSPAMGAFASGAYSANLPPSGRRSPPSRNIAERKEWTVAEDEIICTNVALHGCKWRKIASLLPGRSDDAVRNRWNRLRAVLSPPTDGETAVEVAPPVAKRAPTDGSKPERMSWTKAEDATILSSVAEMGHKWGALQQRLPGRTEHAIRNRFHRLQTMLGDSQREVQRELAPTGPLSLGGANPFTLVSVA